MKRYHKIAIEEDALKLLRQKKAEHGEFITYSDFIKTKLCEKKKNELFPKW